MSDIKKADAQISKMDESLSDDDDDDGSAEGGSDGEPSEVQESKEVKPQIRFH